MIKKLLKRIHVYMNKKTSLEEDNMENKINIAELLKDCPRGMELDCTAYEGIVTLAEVTDSESYPIRVNISYDNDKFAFKTLSKYGQTDGTTFNKCVIFPKGKTTWEGFVSPCKFKDGDIITDVKDSNPFIFHYDNGEFYDVHCALINDYLQIYKRKNNWVSNRREFRYATEEEKQKLFDSIKANGYKWNSETKTLEKLVEPYFKVGNRIKHKTDNTIHTINYIYNDSYGLCDGHLLYFKEQDQYELVSNKFDINTLVPFESRVLVRDTDHYEWEGAVFGRYDGNSFFTIGGIDWKYCIPYKGNEHLYGTTNDCDDFYKTWE